MCRVSAGSDPLPALAALAQTMAVDAAAAEAIAALRAAGVPSLLLKGPALAAWLYPDEHRVYGDADLLVPLDRVERAGAVLAQLGYAASANPPQEDDVIEHAVPWVRAADGAAIDLHHTLSGAAAPERVWPGLHAGADELDGLPVPGRAGLALITALHAAQHGEGRPLEDLGRAVRAPDTPWEAAAGLAGELVATTQMSRGLRLVPGGTELAERLGLPGEDLLDAGPTVLGLERLAAARGVRAKLAIVRAEAFPAPEFLRWWRPWAGRSRVALAAAYVYRVGWLVVHVPRGISERRARRGR